MRTTCANLLVVLMMYPFSIPPRGSHIHTILEDELSLVLRPLCLEVLDDSVKALHYNFERYPFIRNDDFIGLVQYYLQLEEAFSAHEIVDYVVDFFH